MPAVSVIVPAHNAGPYLEKCIDSVLGQDFRDIELILVNDGATDGTCLICERAEGMDGRVKVIRQGRKGVGAARNVGIAASSGDYLQFVDADDTLQPGATGRLYQAVSQSGCKLARCGYRIVDGDTCAPIGARHFPRCGLLGVSEFLEEFGKMFYQVVFHNCWNAIYSADMVKREGIRFNESLSMGEDLLFNFDCLRRIDRLYVCGEELYNYTRRSDGRSLVSSFKPDLFENRMLVYGKVWEFMKEFGIYWGENRALAELRFLGSINSCLYNLFHPDAPADSEYARRRNGMIHRICEDKTVREIFVRNRKRLHGELRTAYLLTLIGNAALIRYYYGAGAKSAEYFCGTKYIAGGSE